MQNTDNVLSTLERAYKERPADFTNEEDALLLELINRAKRLEEELVTNWHRLRKGTDNKL